jgi:hypothetical protein
MGLVPLFDLGLNYEDQLCGTRRRDSGGRYHELSPIERLIYSHLLLARFHPSIFCSPILWCIDINKHPFIILPDNVYQTVPPSGTSRHTPHPECIL